LPAIGRSIASKLAPTTDHRRIAPTLFSYRPWRCDNAFTMTTNRHHGADLRKGRFSELGRIYLVTAVTRGRSPFFCDLLAARTLIRELLACDETGLTKTWAFVVMPDHLHWLVELGTGHLSSAVRRVKSNSAIRLNRLTGAAGRPVWQRGFHDHALRHEEDLRETARYVVANPVRAGLAESVHGYPHWDAAWLWEQACPRRPEGSPLGGSTAASPASWLLHQTTAASLL